MGAKRKVTAAFYKKVKAELKSSKDDKKIMKKYKLGQTTVRAIRNTDSYKAFVDRTSKKKPVIIINPKALPLTPAEIEARRSDRAVEIAAWICAILMVVAAVIIIRWVFGVAIR